ncbi:host specificity factor TipJ family phage tail protein [Gilliamella apicola]|uniref:Tip attachment protein J domain-containing protein n=1 Tax=Gilliamella apicola TaxID=1196095 RepID=A0A2V4E211_9GAMM|nr:host specificity factor TipJ family phage tail protein [Gilliamella apicola]PXZ04324.1 hypothetical protein DKK79_08165 [Gilliamella apicola]
MLIYCKDPNGLTGNERYDLNTSLSLFQNIKNHLPKSLNHQTIDIYLNGEKIDPLTFDLSRTATVFDKIVIVNRQQASTVVAIVVAVVAAVVAYALTPKPKVPNNSGEQKDSTNNKLTGQTNIARLYQAKPDIYGCVRSYPDIVNPAGSEYINNVKYIEHLFCVGVGYYEFDKFKYDQTLLDKIAGTAYTVYHPGDIIPVVRYQFPSAEVDGQELVPPNLSNEVLFEKAYKNLVGLKLKDDTVTMTLNSEDNVDYLFNLPKPVEIHFIVRATITTRSEKTYRGNVVYRATLMSTTIENNQPVLIANNVHRLRFEPKNGLIRKFTVDKTYVTVQHTGGVYTDAFILPEAGTEIWTDLVFQRGLKGDVLCQFVWWVIDDFGNEVPGTRETTLWGEWLDTYEPQSITVKIKPSRGKNKYALIIGRLNNGKSDLSDQVKVENVYIVDFDYNYRVKDTLIYVRTRATSQATSLKELKFNVEATRKTISYNRNTKQIDYTLKPSRSFADAVLHQFVAVFGRDPNELDLDSLYAIDEKLKSFNERLGYFDFSFDDIDVSLGQRIETICNAARVYVYRDGQKWRFARNEEKLRPVAMFNSLNLVKSDTGGTVQKKSSLPSTFDGVQVEYIDSSKDRPKGTDKKAYIDLRIVNNQIIKGCAFRPNKLQLSGCRNYEQAMNRAQLEIRRLIYERTLIEDEVINDANLVDKGDLVLWSDTYDETIVSGEIIRIENKTFYVDQELTLDPNKMYRVAITNKGGYPSNWINITSHNKNSFVADYADAYVANNIDIQCGSIFIITEIISEEPTEFILTKKQFNNGVYHVNLTNYDSRIYEYDRENGYFTE